MLPRLTIDLDAVALATRRLAADLRARGLTLAGVTKCVDGEPAVGRVLLEAGCAGLADSRLPSLVRLAGQALGPLTLIRAPQWDELETTAQVADRVLLSDPGAARVLGEHAPGAPIQILLTVDLGDRREGVLPDAAPAVAAEIAGLPGVELAGVAVNFACLSGQLPSAGAVPAGRGRPGRDRRPVRRRAGAQPRRHLRRPAAGRLPAALRDRGALRRRPHLRLRLRQRLRHHRARAHRPRAHRGRTRVPSQAAGAGGPRRPRRLRPRARRRPAGRGRVVRHARPRAPGHGTGRSPPAPPRRVSRRRHERRLHPHRPRAAASRRRGALRRGLRRAGARRDLAVRRRRAHPRRRPAARAADDDLPEEGS